MGLLTLRDADGVEYDVAVVFGDVMYRKGSTEERPITDLQALKAAVVAVRIVEAHPFGTLSLGATAAGPSDAPSDEGNTVTQPERPRQGRCMMPGCAVCAGEWPPKPNRRGSRVVTLQEFDD
jgi:hypothetical protein